MESSLIRQANVHLRLLWEESSNMPFRFSTWLCVCLYLVGGAAFCNEGPTENDSTQPTLDQLKAEGASRSKYLLHQKNPGANGVNVDSNVLVPKANVEAFQREIQPLLEQTCVQCHGPDAQEGNIRIDTLDPDLANGKDVDWWLEVQAVLSNGEMPPPDADELTDQNRTKIVDWLANEIQVASTIRRATGGHSSFRRMTRYEYNYAMQDILGLPWDFAKDLPPEAHSEDGFQNSSEMLHMTVTQLETYRQLALKALQRATVQGEQPEVIRWGISMQEAADREWRNRDRDLQKLKDRFKDDPEKQQQEVDKRLASFTQPHDRPYYRKTSSGETVRANWAYHGAKYAFAPVDAESNSHFPETFDHVAVIPPGRNQNLTVELGDRIPDEGMMRVRIRASRSTTEENRVPSLQLVFGFQASNEGKAVDRASVQDTPITATAEAPEIYEWHVPLGEIYPRNAFRNSAKMGGLPSPSEFIRFVNTSVPQGQHGDIQIDFVEVTTPVYEEWPPASHKQIFIDSESRDNEEVYAREVLATFMSRAWRRGLSENDVDQKMKLFNVVRQQSSSLEDAMLEVLATVLSSSRFLYVVVEGETAAVETVGSAIDKHVDSTSAQLSAHELATRLSMFLWCSVPDEHLLQLAESGQLQQPDVLADEVQRMLADQRSQRFAKHFVHQWLDMQLLDFKAFEKNSDPLLKEAMQHEPIALFAEILRRDESVLNFVHADYTMVNEILAVHYGLPNVQGNHFRPVPLDASHKRGGLLTSAGLLAMNSDGTDSHPLKRGVWLLESLLNDPPPPPPPAVPEIDLADPAIAKMTLKQRIEDHRNHAACLSCHAKIDPWGIAFENYDAIGRWRDEINGQPVDAASLLFNNQKLDGMDGLKRFLLENRQDQFVRAMVHKIATYALGRPLTFSDYASIDNITADVRRQKDGLATLVSSLVTSELFQSR